MRLIDADAFKKHLASFVVGGEKAIKETTCGNEWIDGVHTAYREIDDMPTVARPHGEWIDEDYGIGKCWATCSECGESTNGEAQDHGFGYDYSFPNFCPNCGASMRMKEGEAE